MNYPDYIGREFEINFPFLNPTQFHLIEVVMAQTTNPGRVIIRCRKIPKRHI